MARIMLIIQVGCDIDDNLSSCLRWAIYHPHDSFLIDGQPQHFPTPFYPESPQRTIAREGST
jgi:hypothetical protein